MKKKKIINIPSVELDKPHINRQDMERIVNEQIKQVNDELSRGLKFIRSHPRSVTIFGSARFDEENPYYKKARELGSIIVQSGFAVVTGGDPGIMEGANRGAFESKGSSLGFVIELPTEQVINPYVNGYESFEYFFTRKVCLSFSAEAFIFMPGGFGSDFWKPLDSFIQNVLENEYKTISSEDKNLYVITDDIEEVLRIIKEAPLRMG